MPTFASSQSSDAINALPNATQSPTLLPTAPSPTNQDATQVHVSVKTQAPSSRQTAVMAGDVIVAVSSSEAHGLRTQLYTWKFGEMSNRSHLPLSTAFTSSYTGVHAVVADSLRRWLYLATTEKLTGLPAIVRTDFNLTQPVILHRGQVGDAPIMRMQFDAPQGHPAAIVFQNGRSAQLQLLQLRWESLMPASHMRRLLTTDPPPIDAANGQAISRPAAALRSTAAHPNCLASNETRFVMRRDQRVYTLAWFARSHATTLCVCPLSWDRDRSSCDILFESFQSAAPAADPELHAESLIWVTTDRELVRVSLRSPSTPEAMSVFPASQHPVSLVAIQTGKGMFELRYTVGCSLDAHINERSCSHTGGGGKHSGMLGAQAEVDETLVLASALTAVYYIPWPTGHIFSSTIAPTVAPVNATRSTSAMRLRNVAQHPCSPESFNLRCAPWWMWLIFVLLLVLAIAMLVWLCCRRRTKTLPADEPPLLKDEASAEAIPTVVSPPNGKVEDSEQADVQLSTGDGGDTIEDGTSAQPRYYHIQFRDAEEPA